MKRKEACPACGDRLVGLYYDAGGKRMVPTQILYCRRCGKAGQPRR